MSGLDEKMQPLRRMGDDVARQTLAQLRKRWGIRAFAETTGVPAPKVLEVEVDHGARVEVWRRADNGTKGESTTYELQRRGGA